MAFNSIVGAMSRQRLAEAVERQNTFSDLGTSHNPNHAYGASLGGLGNAWGTNRWLGFGRATNFGSGLGILTPRQDPVGTEVDRVENYRGGPFRRRRQRTIYKTVQNELPQYDIQADMRGEGDYNYQPYFIGGTSPSQYANAAPQTQAPAGQMLGLSGFGMMGGLGGFGGFGGAARDRFSY